MAGVFRLWQRCVWVLCGDRCVGIHGGHRCVVVPYGGHRCVVVPYGGRGGLLLLLQHGQGRRGRELVVINVVVGGVYT